MMIFDFPVKKKSLSLSLDYITPEKRTVSHNLTFSFQSILCDGEKNIKHQRKITFWLSMFSLERFLLPQPTEFATTDPDTKSVFEMFSFDWVRKPERC